MATTDTGSGGGFSLNFAALLALLTVVGSVLVATRQLHTERPLTPPSSSKPGDGTQTYEARLWEDPFSPWMPGTAGGNVASPTDVSKKLVHLRAQINERSDVSIIPVMVPGQSYSEEREMRIRSRFAIVSAMGQSGYVPEDSGHIGIAQLPWLGLHALESDGTNSGVFDFHVSNAISNSLFQSTKSSINLSFEWYRSKTFRSEANAERHESLLVLWLNEDDFADAPLIRLSLLNRLLTDNLSQTHELKVIGPMFSHTLRGMVGGEYAPKSKALELQGKSAEFIKKSLSNCSLYLATPNAMDEAFVETTQSWPGVPRDSVKTSLVNSGFKTVRNFAAIDSQLAREVFDELKLRNVELENPENHLVIVSEWDSFYGRMLSLTYAAELAIRQGKVFSRDQYVQLYRKGDTAQAPDNLKSFVFERGLDGQAGNSKSSPSPQLSDLKSDKPKGLDRLKQWTPDGNKAEGQAQFDYLSRLGGSIEQYDQSLKREGKGRVRAIGIVGGDTYDTLLILQALRSRFPNVLFFTTELDARLWSPDEWEWTHNLIVASGYGLQLSPKLQRAIPPFRSSMQTSQYAAALAALGEPSLAHITEIPARRFEIGRSGAVDLSITPDEVLHPRPVAAMGLTSSIMRYLLPGICGFACLFGLGVLALRPLRAITIDWRQSVERSLWFRHEDIGDLKGFRSIFAKLKSNPDDEVAQWLRERSVEKKLAAFTNLGTPQSIADASTGPSIEQTQEFLDFLNERLDKHTWQDPRLKNAAKGVNGDDFPPFPVAPKDRNTFAHKLGLNKLLYNRWIADWVLAHLQKLPEGVSGNPPGDDNPQIVLKAAMNARKVGIEGFHERKGYLLFLWSGWGLFLVAALGLTVSCLSDNFSHAAGEPLSFSTGTSAWPSICLRLLALFLSWAFIARSYSELRSAAFDITRRYRLPWPTERTSCRLSLPTTPIPLSFVNASELWGEYHSIKTEVQR